jgi:hypothetical protein
MPIIIVDSNQFWYTSPINPKIVENFPHFPHHPPIPLADPAYTGKMLVARVGRAENFGER